MPTLPGMPLPAMLAPAKRGSSSLEDDAAKAVQMAAAEDREEHALEAAMGQLTPRDWDIGVLPTLNIIELNVDYFKASIEKIVTCIDQRENMSTYAGDKLACDSTIPKLIGGGVDATAPATTAPANC